MGLRRKLSLSQRLFVLTAIALLPALMILGYNEYALRQTREAEVHGYALRIAELASLEMERILTGAAALLLSVGSAPVTLSGNTIACDAYLRGLRTWLSQVSLISITDAEGNFLCSTEDSSAPDRMRGTPTLMGALETEIAAIGEYIETSAGPALQLGAKVTRVGDEPPIFVFAALSLEHLGNLLRERDFADGSALTIADRNGRILAREPFSERFVGTYIPEQYMPFVQGESTGTMELVSQDGTQRIVGYYPATRRIGLYISAGVSVAEAMQPINDATRNGLALAALGGGGAFLLAWLFGRGFIRAPVLQLTRTIQAWREGDKTARTEMKADSMELTSVGAAIDQLLDQLAAEQAAREAAERHRDLLNGELEHRMKNLLATIQAVASQTFQSDRVSDEARNAFSDRLSMLARTHGVLTRESWNSAEIHGVIDAVLNVFEGDDRSRCSMEGPRLKLNARAALALSMALHELCTNALKYGALSNSAGAVDIRWGIEDQGPSPRFFLSWAEKGGPPVTRPSRRGFGSQMIERLLAAELQGEVKVAFRATGLRFRIACPLDQVADVRTLEAVG